ncbi:hypothetical protein IEK_05291 [Bacillus toyonensis]|uniref:CFI-box-CTERM domain-containing protein n=1 Tax=Bacillus toyonensis TaxID=155322 RepID=UPI00027BEC02|nr:CFI-box-CTERM domain-containing protein [Bacillus toyonensis]EJV43952.1 hypothetical protein IEK_05291 [Bacillus toyonensis]PED97867.1 hypothetical protein CON78_24890 [Bacillus toyonensis]PEN79352.1 hypothetical protein CN544_22360 [Bacillus toyonensis]PHD30904.1 hypothetical protein COF48_27885 [Bacillus toyonensis]
MTILIVDKYCSIPLASYAVFFRDLTTICSNDNLFLGFQDYTSIAGYPTYKVTYQPQSPLSKQFPGVALIDYLVNTWKGTVMIYGLHSDDPIPHHFLKKQYMKQEIGFSFAGSEVGEVFYDIDSCNGDGHAVYDENKQLIDIPPDVVLFHELSHIKLGNNDDDKDTLTIKEENLYRKSKGLPLRSGHEGSACTSASPKPEGWSPGWSIKCYIATAATGGPNSPEVRFLRGIRENQLLRTRWGRQFFETFYEHYYRFSPTIADEMHKDPELKDVFGWALVTPLLNYLRLVITRPDWDLNNVPMPLRNYLENMGKDMDEWLAKIELPMDFESLTPEEASIELATILSYVLRSPSARAKYLEDLTQRGALPLSGDEQKLILANRNLTESKISLEERTLIVGSGIINNEGHDVIKEMGGIVSPSLTEQYREPKGLPLSSFTRGSTTSSDCFITTAAKGSSNSSKFHFLKEVGKNQLLRTRWGRQFLDTFYQHYYRFSSAIADEMHKDSELKDVFGWGLVNPLLNYYHLIITRPDWDLDDVPVLLRNYLENMGKDMDEWLAKIELPMDFESLTPEEASIELFTILRYVLRSPSARAKYLEDLTRKGVLPLSGNEQALILANRSLTESKIPLEDRIKILGTEIINKEETH